MRISDDEKQNLIKVLTNYIGAEQAQLYLFGSRTKDHLRGGDIDLLLIVKLPLKENLSNIKHVILASIKEKLGDQKIDLTIATKDQVQQETFLQGVLQEGILLHSWP